MSFSRQEITNIRKSALHTVTLSSEMKTSVVDAKLRELNAEIKKVLTNKDKVLEVISINHLVDR
jgi:hypothetical protein